MGILSVERLYRDNFEVLVRYGITQGLTREQAEDIAQEVFTDVLIGKATPNGKANVRTFLISVFKRKQKMFIRDQITRRKAEKRFNRVVNVEHGEESAATEVEAMKDAGYTQGEIAKKVGVNRTTISRRVRKK